MITLKQHIEKLLELQALGYADLPVIYASDDEGTNYHLVSSEPSEFIVEGFDNYYLEPAFEYDEKNNQLEFITNCIIIN